MHSWKWVSVCVYAAACEKQQRVIYVNECHRTRKEEEAEFPGLMSGLMIHQPRLRQASIMDDRVGHAGLLAPWLKRSTAKRLTSSLFLPSFHGDKYRRCIAHARRCTPAHLVTHMPLPRSLLVQPNVISPLTFLIGSHPFLISLPCFFNLNPILLNVRHQERSKREEQKWARRTPNAFGLNGEGSFLLGDKKETQMFMASSSATDWKESFLPCVEL